MTDVLQSGNFDFPPASHVSPAGTRPPNRHLLNQRLRELHTMSARMEESTRSPSEPPARPAETPSLPSTRRILSSIRRRGGPPPFSAQANPPAGSLMQELENVSSVANSVAENLRRASRQPDTRTDRVRREDSNEDEVSRRRKRRKTDHPERPSSLGTHAFKYGDKGSVVPGPLMMEIEACDGGILPTLSMHGQRYAVENVLRNNKSVYCTHQSQCNLILRHKGEATFSLTKLVIKSPEAGFTAP